MEQLLKEIKLLSEREPKTLEQMALKLSEGLVKPPKLFHLI
ncbi:hypothetical protein [Virgibacillus salinus]|uniref:Uncharacterized protein n=1 Tax=Virgibacillus salinus TaxID=553311 RepID=A0A1H0XTF9_9BACI|nr:hypothetical protein [Virgibacillus salinus]SDQ06145.1 hypothetical protein SAMN05216231_0187 [Virgibacillus salinus]